MNRVASYFSISLCGVVAFAWLAHAQERIEHAPIEIINPGAPTDDAQLAGGAPAAWHEQLSPAMELGIVALALALPTGLVVAGRLWRRQPPGERALILLCVAIGRGRGFRTRVRSLATATGPGGRPITPVAMMLAPRAFDAALTQANHAERAYGQPLRHAVHGFRKG